MIEAALIGIGVGLAYGIIGTIVKAIRNRGENKPEATLGQE